MVFPDGFGEVKVEGPWAAALPNFFVLQLRLSVCVIRIILNTRRGPRIPSEAANRLKINPRVFSNLGAARSVTLTAVACNVFAFVF